MNVTTTPAPRSSVLLEVEVPADRLDREVAESVRRLSRRTRVPGFRPGKAPRSMLERVIGPGVVLEDAVDRLIEVAYREAVIETGTIPLGRASIEIRTAEEGKPVVFTATVPVPPEVTLGDYRAFPFAPEIDVIDDAKVAKVIEELRDQHSRLDPVVDRGMKVGDYAVIGFTGTRDGVAFEGGSAERAPIVVGEERFIPGFEDALIGMAVSETREFDLTFPADYHEEDLAGREVHFSVTLRELREKVAPEVDDDLARSVGDYADLDALRAEVKRRLEQNALDRARHRFADRIVEYAVANATVDPPDLLVDEELEVLHDEFVSSMARQGIAEEAYLKATGKTADEMLAEMRPDAERRVKTLLVLSRVADAEGAEVPPERIDAEVAEARLRYASNPRLAEYVGSERARASLRSSLRRSIVVERIIDGWLAAHPDHPPLPHIEDAAPDGAPDATPDAATPADGDEPSVEA